MTVICWEGLPRTGKTRGMVEYAYPSQLMGWETSANFDVYWERTKKLDMHDILDIPFTDLDRNPKQVLIQEADKWFDSWVRNEDTRVLSSFTGQAGKRNLDILYDTQYFSRIQKALRRITEFLIECSAYVIPTGYKRYEPIAFEYQINRLGAGEERIPIGKPITLPINMSINGKKVYEYYYMYNSYEATMPIITENGREIIQ